MRINEAQWKALCAELGVAIENSTEAGDIILTFPDKTHIEIDVAGNVFHCPGDQG